MKSPQAPRILVVSEPHADIADCVESLSRHTELRIVAGPEQADAALRDGRFDFVLYPARSAPASPSPAAVTHAQEILERIGQAICLLAPDGRITWSNSFFSSLPADATEMISNRVSAICRGMASAPSDVRHCELVQFGREYCYDVCVSAVRGADGGVAQFVAIAWDDSRMHRLQEKINAIDAAGRELVGLDAEKLATMDFGQRLALIEEKIIRLSHELLRFDHLVVRILDSKTNRLDTVLACGLSEEAKSLEIYALADGRNGISGMVAATGRPHLCTDVTKEPQYLPGLEGARSSLTVPLRMHDQVVGILNVESDQVAAFTEDDLQFAAIFARYIAMALHILRMMVVERHTTTGQLAADVDAEVASPLNEIVRDVQTLIADYGQDAGLGQRLKEILAGVDHVKDAIHSVTEPGPVQGLVPESAPRDPVVVGKSILIADDEDIIRETVADLLSKAGAKVVMARDGAEAVRIIQQNCFDLVLSDIK
ncbi:MAG: GAF domain-containing protein, partial [Planctomycetes bacterium]|nr:GAF domain-containing protein [Planctomycetota bacterium]